MSSISVAELFRGQENTLILCKRNVLKGIRASENAKLIERVLPSINENAGQPMDALYLAFMVEYVQGLGAELS